MSSFYPFYAPNEDAFLGRLQHFVAVAPGYTAVIAALTQPNIAGMNLVADFLDALRGNTLTVAEYSKGLTQTKQVLYTGAPGGPAAAFPPLPSLVMPGPLVAGELNRLKALILQIQADPNYTKAIGADLGIETPAPPSPSPDLGPTFTLVMSQAEQVTLKYPKGRWAGVDIESRLAGTLEWAGLGMSLYSPFVDTRPLAVPNKPETREYRGCYLDKGVPSNVWSAILPVTVGV